MCAIFKRCAVLRCARCKSESVHLLERIQHCRKATYSCALCGYRSGLRIRALGEA